MNSAFVQHVQAELAGLRESGFFKPERVIASHQRADIRLRDGREVLNFCANNYLGLADDPRLIEAAKRGLDAYGYGVASVRFICGTQAVHKELEAALSRFLGTEDTLLYSSCFDANGGVFETLLGEQDAVISDELNHASIIDGIRLSKAQRYRYRRSAGAVAGCGDRGRPLQADRHGRRVLDGRDHCRSGGHLRAGRPPRCAGDGR